MKSHQLIAYLASFIMLPLSTAYADEAFTSVELPGQWKVQSAKVFQPNDTKFTNKELLSEVGKVFSFSSSPSVNAVPVTCSKPFIPKRDNNPVADSLQAYNEGTKPLEGSCKRMNGDKLSFTSMPNEYIDTDCYESSYKYFPNSVNPIDAETMLGNVNGYYTLCLKRIDVNELKLSSHRVYGTSSGVKGKHEFVFDFPFRVPSQLTASQGNAGQSLVYIAYRPLGSKTKITCSYKGNAPKALKNKPVPVSNRFAFEKCSNGAKAGDIASGAVFTLSVNGGPQLAGADRTAVDLTLAREGQ